MSFTVAEIIYCFMIMSLRVNNPYLTQLSTKRPERDAELSEIQAATAYNRRSLFLIFHRNSKEYKILHLQTYGEYVYHIHHGSTSFPNPTNINPWLLFCCAYF